MIYEKTLPNGFEIVVHRTEAPVAALQVWVDVGSVDETPKEAGYCHFLEHMLFKGTASRTTKDIAGSVEGAGGEMNAFTSFEYTVFHITLSNERWRLANDILSDMLLHSTFKPSEFSPEKEVILEEIRRSDDSSDRQLYQGIYASLYGRSGYGRPVIGFPRTVQRCTSTGLKAFWKKWYAPELMTLVVCGNVDPKEVERQAMKSWGRATTRALRPRRRNDGFSQRIAPAKALTGSRTFPVNSIRWVAALPACTIRDERLPALDVASMILGQGDSSRLHRRLFREDGSVTSIDAGVWAPAGIGMLTFDAEASLEKGGTFRRALFEEVARLQKDGPAPDEMERARVAIETDRVYGSQSMDGLANRLGFLRASMGNSYYDLEFLSRVRDLTAEDVREAACRFMNMGELREFALFPEKYAKSDFWKTDKKENSRGVSRPVTRKRDAEQISLPNGIELILNTRSDVPVVSMQACVLAGTRAEDEGTSGIGHLLSDAWEKGPVGWGAEKFAAFLESRGTRMDAFSGRNSMGLSCTTLTRNFEEIAPLFAETLFSPALEAEELQRAQAVALEDIRTLEDDPGRLVGRMFCENLFEGHPYARSIIGSKDSVSKLNRDRVARHFQSCVGAASVFVSVSGKFQPSAIVTLFEKLKRGPIGSTVPSKLPFTSPKAPRVVERKKNREQSHLIVGFTGTRITDVERFDLKILLTVLGGQSGRLFTELRDKGGLCYTVSPISFEGLEPGYVGVYVGCDPRKREEALAGIKKQLELLITHPVKPAELKRAREFLLGRHHMELQLNSTIAAVSAFNMMYGLGCDEHLKLAEGLQKVSARSVQALAARIFGSPAVTALVI